MPKRSSLAKKITGQICPVPDIRYPDHLITGPKKCPKSDHLNTGRFGIRMLTVLDIRNPEPFEYRNHSVLVFKWLYNGRLLKNRRYERVF